MEDDTFDHFEELLDIIDFDFYEAINFADETGLIDSRCINCLKIHLKNFRDWRQNREKRYIKKGG